MRSVLNWLRTSGLAAVCLYGGLYVGSAPPQALAAVIYNNGLPTISNGSESTKFVFANDFMVSSATNVTGGTIFIAGTGGIGNWNGSLNYWVFADNGSDSPSSILASGALSGLSASSVGAQNWPLGGDVYGVNFNFVTPFLAAPTTKYWLGVHLANDFSTRKNIYWIRTPLTAFNGARSMNSADGLFNNWALSGYENAFSLNGSAASAPVPEPTSMAIFGLGALGLAYRNRRKLVK